MIAVSNQATFNKQVETNMPQKRAIEPLDVLITAADIDAAQHTAHMLLAIARSQPETIGIGALLMATSLAAREMNIPIDNVSAIFHRTLAEVYTIAGHQRFACTVN